MIVLAIDTAGIGCYAALYDSETETVLGAAGANIGRGHAEQLFDFVDQALEAAGLTMSAIERIAVTVGPGSFTGIRVGVAAARGLALALSVPVVGVSTFQALAGDRMGVGSLLVAMDAKRDEIYWQLFSTEGAELSPPTVGALAEASAITAGHDGDVAGSAAPLLRDGAPPQTDGVSIAAVARLGAALDPAAHPAKPLYLRGPDVKPQAGFAVRRA